MTIFAGLRTRILLAFALVFAIPVSAQYGGTGVFSVLKQPANGRQAAWGGYSPAYQSGDANAMLANPALLGAETNNAASMNFNTQFKGVWSGNGAYCTKFNVPGYFGLAVGYIDYGTMNAYDAGGNSEGTTSANETVFALGYANKYRDRLSYGANLKAVYSVLGPYIGNGVALDLGATWLKKDSTLTLGVVVKNAGLMLGTYGHSKREALPFAAEAGVCFKPKHMPFRFNFAIHDLQKFDLTYNQYLKSSGTLDLNGQATVPKPAGFGEKLLRHINVGTELVLGKYFGIMFSYNHQRRQEMGPSVKKGVAGFSWGLNFKVSKIKITYSSASYFPGFNTNLFTFSLSLNDFKTHKPKP